MIFYKSKIVTSFIVAGMMIVGTGHTVFAETLEVPKTPEEQAETDQRKQCKVKVCKVFASKSVEGEDVSCNLVKTVHKDAIEKKYLGGKISWPFGKAQCKTDVRLKREMLVKGATQDGYKGSLGKNTVSCSLFTSDGKDKHQINFTINPTITWKAGKADKVVLNISDIGGTALAKTGIWTIAKANSYFGVLDGPVKKKFNEFTENCANFLAEAK